MSENPAMLTLDPGSSGSKIIWRVSPFRPELLVMSPEVIEVTREDIEFYKTRRVIVSEPEKEAWVEYGGVIYAVGKFAVEHNGRVVLNDLKHEWAVAKVLAAVGVMALKEGMPDNFDLALALPLPYGEWQARERFERSVKKALANFSFCDREYAVNLTLFVCVPEGGGHVLARGEKIGAALGNQKVAIIMLGYRDVSVVLFNNGAISGVTERLGMARMLALVESRTFDQTATRERAQRLLETIHQVGKDIKPKNFLHLALSRQSESKLDEATQIADAVKYARVEQWKAIAKFIQDAVPVDIQEGNIGGGTYDYYRAELVRLMNQTYPDAYISLAAELEEDVRVTFNLPPESKGLCARLTDAYGLSNFLRNQVCPAPSKASASRR